MRFIALLGFLINISFSGCKNARKENVTTLYPKVIDSLDLETLYDLGKWKLYYMDCLDSLKVPYFNFKLSFAQLNYTLDTVILTDSSTEIKYKFLNADNKEIIGYGDFHMPLLGGFVFYRKTDSLILYTSDNDAGDYFVPRITDTVKWLRVTKELSFQERRLSSLFLYEPLQPEVVEYINKNKKTINKWFYSEAVKRGYIK